MQAPHLPSRLLILGCVLTAIGCNQASPINHPSNPQLANRYTQFNATHQQLTSNTTDHIQQPTATLTVQHTETLIATNSNRWAQSHAGGFNRQPDTSAHTNHAPPHYSTIAANQQAIKQEERYWERKRIERDPN